MIRGVGVDLCSVARMERAMKSEHFLERVFSPKELEYAYSKRAPARHLAGSFAAREAFAKAASLSMYSVAFQGTWVERTSSGPVLRFSDLVQLRVSDSIVHLSLSHDGDYAVAMVVIEGKE